MTDTTERDARAAERALAEARAGLQQLAVPDAAATSARLAFDQPVAEAAGAFLTAAATTREALIEWIDATRQGPPGALDYGPGPALAERAAQLRNQAATIDAATFAQRLQTVERQAAELRLGQFGDRDGLASDGLRPSDRR